LWGLLSLEIIAVRSPGFAEAGLVTSFENPAALSVKRRKQGARSRNKRLE
jgi:hypothetical protein